MAELQVLFSQLDQHQLMGFVTDQSPYYPFMTSGSGPARQARIAVSLKKTWISGGQCWSHALSTGQDAQIGRVQRRAETRRNEAAEQKVSSATGVESRCSRLVLPPLLFFIYIFIFFIFRFSLLSWAKPHLVASLPCRYNVLQCSTGIGAVTNSNISCSQEIAIAHFCGSTWNKYFKALQSHFPCLK